MIEKIYAVYGAAGCGRDAMPLARRQLNQLGVSSKHLYFIDDGVSTERSNDQNVINYASFLVLPAKERFVTIAIADGLIRKNLANKLATDNVKPWTVVADNVVYLDDVEIGEGAIINPFVTMAANCRVGKHFHANLYSYIGHDCQIGDYVTFAPRVSCNGNIHIDDHAYIGTGAIIKQGTPDKPLIIGKGAVVGMGAVVTKDVPPGVTVVGNPARPLVKS